MTATPRELAHFLAGLFGVPVATAVHVDRRLEEAGLRRSFGRGSSARRADSADAAALVLALAGAPLYGQTAASAVATVEKYGALPFDDGGLVRPISESPIAQFRDLGFDHTLADALTALFEALIAEVVPARAECVVVLSAPWPKGEVAIYGETAFGGVYSEPLNDDDVSRWRISCASQAKRHGMGLLTRRHISNGDLRAIAAALRGAP